MRISDWSSDVCSSDLDEADEPKVKQEPAVSIRSSVKPDYIVCLEDGEKMKMLRRHLATDHGMTPHEYRAQGNLPKGYPIVAPKIGRAPSRARVCQYVGFPEVAVYLKKKTENNYAH